MQKFGMGQPVRRFEDERFIRGEGCYIDDIRPDGLLHATFVRSPFAHADIVSMDTSAAEQAPGVVKLLTHVDVKAAGLNAFPTVTDVAGVDENGISVPERYALTSGTVKFVGDPVAMVIAETAAQAREAAELVEVDYDDKPVVTDLPSVLDPATPVIWPDIGSNRAYRFHKGDEAATDEVLRTAHHVASLELVNNRLAPSAIEPRGVIGEYIAEDEQYVLRVSGQALFGQRDQMANVIFRLPPDKIRVVMPDVGGGFGAKNFVYPENVMVMLAARLCGRPVKWIAQRTENFLTEVHGRDHWTRVDLALDEDGKFLALKVETLANMGAYLSSYSTIIPTSASWVGLGGVYAIPTMSMTVQAVFTNTTPVDAYRGAGRPEASYLIERIVDVAAREIGIDPLELRRRNFISEFPYTTPVGMLIDCGAFSGNLDIAQERGDLDGFEARRTASKAEGKLRGRGVSTYLEITLGAPVDESEVRFEDDGTVTMVVGTTSTGQGHETAYRQILHDELGLDPDKVNILEGDTAAMAMGGGHGGARSLKIGGSALKLASGEVRDKGIVAAAHVFEASPGEVEFNDGLFEVKGTNQRIDVLELEAALRSADDLPDDVPRTLTSKARFERTAFSYPNGTHLAEVEVDPDTGHIDIRRYTIVDDFGNIVNPLIAAGQAVGGAVQGIGQAMLEGIVYDGDGQLLSGSYMDYALPRADDVSAFDITFNQEAPTATNPLGVKGAGEAGATGAPAAIVNAVMNALKDHGVKHLDMPLTPEKVWRAVRQADAA